MATRTKSATSKTTPRKASAKAGTGKKTPAKRVAPKKTVAKKSAAKSKNAEMRSFHLAQDQPPFTTFQITRQTLYWVILVSFIVFAQLWIISLQVEVAGLLDAQQAQLLDI